MSEEYLHNETNLLTLVAEGNEMAFAQLFELYQDKVYKTSNFYLKSHTLAEEIVQEVFIKVWQRRSQLTEVSHFNTWLLTVTKNYIIDYMRKMASEANALQKLSGQQTTAEDNTTDYKARQYHYQLLVNEAVDGLTPQQKHIYKMAKDEGLTYEQIAEKLSLSPLTVKTHMARALQAIRSFLKNHGEVYLLLLLMGK